MLSLREEEVERAKKLLLEIEPLIREKEAVEEKRRRNNNNRNSDAALEDRMFKIVQKIYDLSTEYYYWMPKKGFEFTRFIYSFFFNTKLLSGWPDLAKFLHLAKFSKFFGKLLRKCVWPNLKPTLAIFINFGQFFAIVSGQIKENNLAIWSHWLPSCYGVANACGPSLLPTGGLHHSVFNVMGSPLIALVGWPFLLIFKLLYRLSLVHKRY